MACGVGVCMTCVMPVVGPDGRTRMVRSCVEGPVFDGGRVRWDAFGDGICRVPADTLTALPEGTYHHHDQVGCEVVAEDGTAIGVVTGVDGHRVASHLVVQGRRGEVLVPLAESICVGFDLEARRITVALPEGLLDLN